MSEEKIIVQIDPELEDLIPGFMINRQSDIELITKAMEKADYATVERIGHILKGAGGGYGFAGISEIGRMMEEAARNKNCQIILENLEKLKQYLKRVEIKFERK